MNTYDDEIEHHLESAVMYIIDAIDELRRLKDIFEAPDASDVIATLQTATKAIDNL